MQGSFGGGGGDLDWIYGSVILPLAESGSRAACEKVCGNLNPKP